MEEMVKKNPWKGLQSYQETDAIYGRDEEIKALYTRIIYNTQTVVYGKSGIGKSSVINAGIIPRAKHDAMLPIAIRLAHTTKKEQTVTAPYVEQIFNRIKEEVIKAGAELDEIVPHVVDHEETLWELLHRYRIWKGKDEERKRLIPLLLFDQFEEIFTLEISNRRVESFFNELADLLNEVRPSYLTPTEEGEPTTNESPSELGKEKRRNVFSRISNRMRNASPEYLEKSEFHLVITLREDFLSYLERYTVYIPVMKQNRFPLLPLNVKQAAKIITEPIKGLVQKDVAEIIIQRVTGNKDLKIDGITETEVDAALLSLYMERLYERKGDDDNIISSELVQFNDDIIKKFYESSIECISEKTVEYLEDELITNANRRNNVARIDLISGGVSEDDLDKLIEKKVLRQFSYCGDLRIEFIHDVLCPIVNDRIEHREQLAKEREAKRIAEEEETRRKKEEAEANARREKERQIQEEKLRKAEVERRFLLKRQKKKDEENELIQSLKEEENAKLREEAIRIKKRNRERLYAASALLLLSVFGIIVYLRCYVCEQVSYYAQFETINGWPVGVGKALKGEELLKTPLYYKLSYKGLKNKRVALDERVLYTDVEVKSSNGHLPNDCRIPMMEWSDNEESDSKAKQLNDILRQVVKIHYSSNEGNEIIGKEEWLGEGDKMLMAVNYFHQPNGGAWAQFYTPNGENMKIRGKGNDIDRLKLSWDSIGNIESRMYYDNKGVVREIEKGKDICGYYWERQGNDTIIRYALNQFGQPTPGVPNNTMMTVCHGEIIETIYIHSSKIRDKHKFEVGCKEGYARMISYGYHIDSICYYEPDKIRASSVQIIERDDHGNVIRLCTKGENLFGFPPIIEYEYKNGLVTKKEWLYENGTPYCQDSTLLYKWEYAYDEKGFRSEEKRIDIYEKLAYHYKINREINGNDTIIITSLMDIRRNPIFVTQVDTVKRGLTTTTFYAENLTKRINSLFVVGEDDSLKVHRVLTVKEGKTITREFFTFDSLKIVPLQTTYEPTYDDSRPIYVKSYFKRIEEYDDVGNMISLRLEDSNGTIAKSMMYIIQNGQVIGRAVKGIEGKPVRCDKWEEEGFLYYKLYYNKDFENQYCGVTAVDEWEHPSAIKWYKESYIKRIPFNFKDKRVFAEDEGGFYLPITIERNLEEYVFQEDTLTDVEMPYVHVLSRKCSMYNQDNPNKSLFDGDRIIQFGNWKFGVSLDLFETEWEKMIVGGNPVKIVVLRPTDDSYIRIPLSFMINKPQDAFIEYHFLKMTEDEKSFVEKWLN